MSAPRAVRIPRVRPAPGASEMARSATDTASGVRPSAREGPHPDQGDRSVVRPNAAGSMRALRLTLLYLLALGVLYLVFALYEATMPYSSGTGAENGLLLFSGLATVLAVVGPYVTLSPAPRRIEIRSSSVVVVGRWGGRTEWAPWSEVSLRVVRRYPAGLLSRDPVESIEVAIPGRTPRTYLVGTELFPGTTPHPR